MTARAEIRDLWDQFRSSNRTHARELGDLQRRVHDLEISAIHAADHIAYLEERTATPDAAEDPEQPGPEPERWAMAPGVAITVTDADGHTIVGPLAATEITKGTDRNGQLRTITVTIDRSHLG